MRNRFYGCLAPAKLNLCLHIVGRRADGFHLLESVFQLIDLCDELDFVCRDDGQIFHTQAVTGVTETDDLCVRAARLLQRKTGCRLGVAITLRKRIPIGGGLGGGSSDAATTLAVLNQLWQLNLNQKTLMDWALELGADVPFFLFGRNALAQGIGEQLSEFSLPERVILLVNPRIHVSTPQIFRYEGLTRDTPTLKIRASREELHATTSFNPIVQGHNDLENATRFFHPEVDQLINFMRKIDPFARMTGSGASVFATFFDEEQAEKAFKTVPKHWLAMQTKTLHCHPCQQVSMLFDDCFD